MSNEVDIIENNIIADYGVEIFEMLLIDQSVTVAKDDGQVHHIFWATQDYYSLGEGYGFFDEIQSEAVTGDQTDVIIPRVMKKQTEQTQRAKKMAKVFTPSWVCNLMNNNIDEKWFGRKGVFNEESKDHNIWTTNLSSIIFPNGKTWHDYIKLRWMEITCGEAPFATSRYDTTTGKAIPIENRIGFLDRKLRVINENVENRKDWLAAARIAYQNILAYEWQGDNLLLARESMLYTYIDNYQMKFGDKPPKNSVREIADIISWNVWQMDGLKGVIPLSCHDVETPNLYGEIERTPCPGCKTNNIHKHNGIPALVKSWNSGKAYPFHLLIKKR